MGDGTVSDPKDVMSRDSAKNLIEKKYQKQISKENPKRKNISNKSENKKLKIFREKKLNKFSAEKKCFPPKIKCDEMSQNVTKDNNVKIQIAKVSQNYVRNENVTKMSRKCYENVTKKYHERRIKIQIR